MVPSILPIMLFFQLLVASSTPVLVDAVNSDVNVLSYHQHQPHASYPSLNVLIMDDLSAMDDRTVMSAGLGSNRVDSSPTAAHVPSPIIAAGHHSKNNRVGYETPTSTAVLPYHYPAVEQNQHHHHQVQPALASSSYHNTAFVNQNHHWLSAGGIFSTTNQQQGVGDTGSLQNLLGSQHQANKYQQAMYSTKPFPSPMHYGHNYANSEHQNSPPGLFNSAPFPSPAIIKTTTSSKGPSTSTTTTPFPSTAGNTSPSFLLAFLPLASSINATKNQTESFSSLATRRPTVTPVDRGPSAMATVPATMQPSSLILRPSMDTNKLNQQLPSQSSLVNFFPDDHSIAYTVTKIGQGIANAISLAFTLVLSIFRGLDPSTRQFLTMFVSFAPLGIAGLVGINSSRRVRIAVTISLPIVAFLMSNFANVASPAAYYLRNAVGFRRRKRRSVSISREASIFMDANNKFGYSGERFHYYPYYKASSKGVLEGTRDTITLNYPK